VANREGALKRIAAATKKGVTVHDFTKDDTSTLDYGDVSDEALSDSQIAAVQALNVTKAELARLARRRTAILDLPADPHDYHKYVVTEALAGRNRNVAQILYETVQHRNRMVEQAKLAGDDPAVRREIEKWNRYVALLRERKEQLSKKQAEAVIPQVNAKDELIHRVRQRMLSEAAAKPKVRKEETVKIDRLLGLSDKSEEDSDEDDDDDSEF
jgi:hypothetical protein